MLTNLDLNVKIDKTAYKKELKVLFERLAYLEKEIKVQAIPVLIVFEGWSASGKGLLISHLLNSLDPRNFKVHSLHKETEEAVMRPYLWNYWTKTPKAGQISIFDKSYHRTIINPDYLLTQKEYENFYYDVNAFEQTLVDNKTIIVKLFVHISKEEQKKRIEQLKSSDETSWRVSEKIYRQNDNYDEFVVSFEEMLENTNEVCPWDVIEGNDSRFAVIKVFRSVINRIESELEKRKGTAVYIAPKYEYVDILKTVNSNQKISDSNYKKQLSFYQEKIRNLVYKMYEKRKAVIIAYEGWDAAGKGGNIKRISQRLDPRGYEVIPIAAPSKEELSYHYLWRFWNNIPKDGHVAIFDRTWYGRVLVERIEGFCSEEDWNRAFKEINDMEFNITNHETLIIKFWLQIDKNEQLNRFNMRMDNPLKRYKITDEDWRNREKWDIYERATNDMLAKTSTEYAPWVIIESNNKKYARIKALKYVVEKLEEFLI